ncbi:MAG: hypothetical protein U9R02_04430 [Thermodesulfobacteriota bacterium]|nr:hypothetical protein [Thermodesulfobacteriota bacterium]
MALRNLGIEDIEMEELVLYGDVEKRLRSAKLKRYPISPDLSNEIQRY